jgi:hypothetical protein
MEGVSRDLTTYLELAERFRNTFIGNAAQKEIFRTLLTGKFATDNAGRTMMEYFLDIWSKCNRLQFYNSDQEFLEDISRHFNGEIAVVLRNIATIGGTIDRAMDELCKADNERKKFPQNNYYHQKANQNLYSNPSNVQQTGSQQTDNQHKFNRNNYNNNNYRNRPPTNSRLITVIEDENSAEQMEIPITENNVRETTYECATIVVDGRELLESYSENNDPSLLRQSHTSPFIDVFIDNCRYSALIDCGSEVSLISQNWYEKIKSSLKNTEVVKSRSLNLQGAFRGRKSKATLQILLDFEINKENYA